jgi:hypothetical protein
MDKGTFGSINQYKMLEFLTEKISLMEVKHKNYLSSVIQDINQTIKKSEMINDISFRNYILDLIKNDLSLRIENHIKGKYEEKITTYMENYLNAKIKNSKQK